MYSVITDKRKGVLADILRIFLVFLSVIYSLAIRFISALYKFGLLKTYHPLCKVISIGNITWGGTGKTPLVEKIASYLNHRGCKIAVLSRGYSLNASLTDEPQYLQDNLGVPVLVGRDRIKNAKLASKQYQIQAIILDDGFQHWRLGRDLDIVCIDTTNPFGSGWVLPRGILREPLASLRRADIFFLTKTDLGRDNLAMLKDKLREINPQALIVESIYEALYLRRLNDAALKINTDELRGKRVGLLAGIADPAYFEYMVHRLGINPVLKFYYPDHYAYQKKDLDKISCDYTTHNIDTIITTPKDASRLSGQPISLKPQTLVLYIEVRITKNESEFFSRLSSVCNC